MAEKMQNSDEERVVIIQEIIKQIDSCLKKRGEIDIPKLASISYDTVIDVLNDKNNSSKNSDEA
jgi:hypothetical protein